MHFFHNLLDLLFPSVCCACGKRLVQQEEVLCFRCRSILPKTQYLSSTENELKDRFLGRLPLKHALAALNYHKSGMAQKLLHALKYKGRTEIGEMFGRQMGDLIHAFEIGTEIDLIIPVPLHPKKLRKRGYNQSEFFAKGISEITGITGVPTAVRRIKHGESQTGKSREMRWKSVSDAFCVAEGYDLGNKHILLVDDVVTTGATIEACGARLMEKDVKTISVAAMAVAK
jgi:ComF family protein